MQQDIVTCQQQSLSRVFNEQQILEVKDRPMALIRLSFIGLTVSTSFSLIHTDAQPKTRFAQLATDGIDCSNMLYDEARREKMELIVIRALTTFMTNTII